jgi:hypothetical protein
MKQVESDRSANSFEFIARKWFVKYSPNWVKSHSDKIMQRFVRDIFPWVGNKPITDVTHTHIVPLATQAISILKGLHPLTGNGIFVFPSARTNDRPMSDNAILAALRRLNISKEEATGHGFRATARTLLDEILGVRPDLIEHQLAHAVRDPNGRAYNRTAHLPERRKMMQDWADYLDKLIE